MRQFWEKWGAFVAATMTLIAIVLASINLGINIGDIKKRLETVEGNNKDILSSIEKTRSLILESKSSIDFQLDNVKNLIQGKDGIGVRFAVHEANSQFIKNSNESLVKGFAELRQQIEILKDDIRRERNDIINNVVRDMQSKIPMLDRSFVEQVIGVLKSIQENIKTMQEDKKDKQGGGVPR